MLISILCPGLTWRDLADSCGVPTIALVTVGALYKDGAVAETLSEYLSPYVIESHSATLKDKKERLSPQANSAKQICAANVVRECQM